MDEQPQRFGKPASEIRRPLVVQLGQFEKTRQKLDWKNIVKTTHYSYACNTLTNFEYEGCVMTGNGNYVTWLKLACEIREITWW